jgi:hypothetical protein
MRLVTISLVLSVSVLGQVALKPDHIINDPDAKKIQVVEDVASQRKFGAQMALYMQSLRPTAAINGLGQLRIRPAKGKRKSMAVRFRAFALGATLVNEYLIADGTLTVKQQVGWDTLYEWTGTGKKVERLNEGQAILPFAGSDFWMIDLGLEMLRWPHQSVIERKLRRGELCSVLVSRPAKGVEGGYSKVVSWVDEDSMGIVRAELFDGEGKLLKIFEPKSFKKIEGQWHLKEMEMRNEQANTRTSIVFDLKPVSEPEK